MGRGRSRARSVQRAVELPTLDSAQAHWLRSIRLSGFTIATLTLIVLTVVVLAPSLRILIEQRQEVAALEAQVAAQQAAVDDLVDQRARWDDPSYIQSRARERLDYVYPGEYSFNVIDDVQAPTTANGLPISEDIQTTDVDWVGSLLSSVLTSGLTDAAAGDIVAPPIETVPTEQSTDSPAGSAEPAAG